MDELELIYEDLLSIKNNNNSSLNAIENIKINDLDRILDKSKNKLKNTRSKSWELKWKLKNSGKIN